MSSGDYWLAKTSAGWTVEDRRQVFAVHPTRGAAVAHLDRLATPSAGATPQLETDALPDMPHSDAFCRRFS